MSRNLSFFGASPIERVEKGLASLRKGEGVIVVDDGDRENEGDIIYAADTLTERQMALLIRECSGIVCLCITDERAKQLSLEPMVKSNSSRFGTAFTVTIEAAQGVSTGVSAKDRLTTIRAAIAPDAVPADLARPGHVFPLVARPGGVLERRGHTEASVDLARLAGFSATGVLCELTNPDGTMARLPEITAFSQRENLPVFSVEDLVEYRRRFAPSWEEAQAEAMLAAG